MLRITTKEQRVLRAVGSPPRAPEKPEKTEDRPPAADLPDGPAAKPHPLDRLRGPRRTPWGTWVWSDPAEPPIDLFGPPPPVDPPSCDPAPPPAPPVMATATVRTKTRPRGPREEQG